jgi:hypothetical protein
VSLETKLATHGHLLRMTGIVLERAYANGEVLWDSSLEYMSLYPGLEYCAPVVFDCPEAVGWGEVAPPGLNWLLESCPGRLPAVVVELQRRFAAADQVLGGGAGVSVGDVPVGVGEADVVAERGTVSEDVSVVESGGAEAVQVGEHARGGVDLGEAEVAAEVVTGTRRKLRSAEARFPPSRFQPDCNHGAWVSGKRSKK